MNCANCERPAAPRSALCWRCLKYRKRHGVLPTEPPRSYGDPWETLKAAMRAYAFAEQDQDFARTPNNGPVRVDQRVRMAAVRFAESLGYRKP